MTTAAPASTFQTPRLNILGVNVSLVTLDGARDLIARWVTKGEKNYVCVTGAHGIIECRRDAGLREIHNTAGLVTLDGMPLVHLARRLGCPSASRVYGPDLMLRLSELSAQRGYRQFYFGGAPGVAEQLAERLQARYRGLIVAGTLTPPFTAPTAQEDQAMVEQINAARPDIVWIGLSTPKQERWMASHLNRITAPAMVGVGAAFDFLAGRKKQAPAWMQAHSLEWLFRLSSEPRRLWRRYARIVPTFAILATLQLMEHHRVNRAHNG